MISITKKNKLEEEDTFVPHMAMTHNLLNGGAANGMNKPLSMKSAKPLTKSELDVIEKLEGKAGVVKASYRNTQRMLERVITDNVKASLGKEYAWVWLKDFDETTAVFEYDDITYGVNYSVSETGMITLSGEVQEVVQQDVYVTEDGKNLVLKYKNSSDTSGEILKKGVNPENEGNDIMSAELQEQIVALQKAAVDQEAATQELIKQALAKQAAEVAELALVKSTTDLVKSFASIAEADQEALVKSLVALGDDSVLIIKALSDMQESVIKAEAATVVAEESAELIKSEFAGKDAGIDAPAGEVVKGTSMKEAVNAVLARTSNK
jgi:hypothetical protein